MDKLGQYITQEYGLLKQILRYLTVKDLITARKVCRAWAEVVEVILAEENKLIWGYTLKPGDDWAPGKFVQIIPRVIFYYTSKLVSGCDDLDSCPCKHGDVSTELIMMRDGVLNCQTKSLFGSGAYDFMLHSSCMFLLPSMPGVEVNSLSITRKDKIIDQKVTDETLNQLIGNEPIKCLLIYSYTSSTKTKIWINSFLKKVVDRQGSNTVAIGGGDSNELIIFKGKERCQIEKPLIYIITFRGDNVTAHSQLLKATTKPGIDEFMDRMSNDVGPMPSGAQRFAFVVKCVNRCFFWDNTIEDMTYEGEKFKEAFPGIPHYGFFGFGEYGINTLASDCSEIKRRKYMKVLCSNTTSFVILTLHNVPQSRKKLQL